MDLCNGVLTLAGDVAPWEGPDEKDILIEYKWAAFTAVQHIRNHRPDRIDAHVERRRVEAHVAQG